MIRELPMDPWVKPAIDYFRLWMDHQIRSSQQPGCIVAIAYRGRVISEFALGHSNLVTSEKLTPRHRFRIASHSKSFTAAGLMKLREQRRVRLDDPVGQYVQGLHPQVAETTIGQILSHSAGFTRDGADAGQFTDQRPFLNAREVMAELSAPPAIDPGLRLKYSNVGFALLGMVIENITGEPYRTWIEREIVDAAGLQETEAATPLARPAPLAGGHTPLLPLGRRLVVPGDVPQHAITPAGGFVSTAADAARFFAQLSPKARNSVLSPASRREMTRRHWRNPDSIVESYYGLGIMSGSFAGWDWFGHSGGLQGYISRTAVIPTCDLTIVVLSNASDGLAWFWLDGALHILRAFADRGAPSRRVRDWTGRWWTASGAADLVPMGNRVLVGSPVMGNPFFDATEIEVTGRDSGRIVKAAGYASFGQAVRRTRGKGGQVSEVWLAGSKLRPEKTVMADLERRYGTGRRTRR
jgi:CubicO group peptidase (beta-lactamase class C family)